VIGITLLTVGLSVLVLALLLSFALSISKIRLELPADSPKAWLEARAGGGPADRALAVCAGDSITHGAVSVNYVAMLKERLPELDFVNAGVNSELAWNLYQRLDPIIALKPDFISILIGSNDANATLGFSSSLAYLATQRLPEMPSPQFYKEMLTLIVRRLKTECAARIGLLSTPPIGEDPKHYAWLRTEEYAGIVKQVAFSEGVDYLPLRERMCAYLEQAPKQRAIAAEDLSRATQRAFWANRMLGKSLDEISAANGFHLLVDGIHLNSHAAIIVADLVERFIQDGRKAARIRELAGEA
jgi:lysophospholipase L1-like esterase